jgi:hypothetical protein
MDKNNKNLLSLADKLYEEYYNLINSKKIKKSEADKIWKSINLILSASVKMSDYKR